MVLNQKIMRLKYFDTFWYNEVLRKRKTDCCLKMLTLYWEAVISGLGVCNISQLFKVILYLFFFLAALQFRIAFRMKSVILFFTVYSSLFILRFSFSHFWNLQCTELSMRRGRCQVKLAH